MSLNPMTWFGSANKQAHDGQLKVLVEISKQLSELNSRLDTLSSDREAAQEAAFKSLSKELLAASIASDGRVIKELKAIDEGLCSEVVKLGSVITKSNHEAIKAFSDAVNSLALDVIKDSAHHRDMALKAISSGDKALGDALVKIQDSHSHDFEGLVNSLNSEHNAGAKRHQALAEALSKGLNGLEGQVKTHFQGLETGLAKRLMVEAMKPASVVAPAPVTGYTPAPAVTDKNALEAMTLAKEGFEYAQRALATNTAPTNRDLFDVQVFKATGEVLRIVASGSRHEAMSTTQRAAPFEVKHALLTQGQANRIRELLKAGK